MSVKVSVEIPTCVLQLKADNPNLTMAEMADIIGNSTRTVERAAARLQREGKLKFIGPRKGGYWQVL